MSRHVEIFVRPVPHRLISEGAVMDPNADAVARGSHHRLLADDRGGPPVLSVNHITAAKLSERV